MTDLKRKDPVPEHCSVNEGENGRYLQVNLKKDWLRYVMVKIEMLSSSGISTKQLAYSLVWTQEACTITEASFTPGRLFRPAKRK